MIVHPPSSASTMVATFSCCSIKDPDAIDSASDWRVETLHYPWGDLPLSSIPCGRIVLILTLDIKSDYRERLCICSVTS